VHSALLNSFYRLLEMHVPVLAGGLAFFGAISVFPLLALVLLCYGFLSTPADAIAFIDSVKHLMPKDAHPAISSELALLADWAPHHLTPSILLAIALITWSAMSGWKALIAGVRLVAHDHSQISIAGFQFRSLLLSFFSIGAIVTAIVVFVLFVRILAASESGAEIATPPAAGAKKIRLELAIWALASLGIYIALLMIYRVAISRSQASLRHCSQGAAVGALAWFIAITVFDYYAETASWRTIYGTLTGIIAFLLWFYISAYTALLGAAFAASMNESGYT
jgi:membrane protein